MDITLFKAVNVWPGNRSLKGLGHQMDWDIFDIDG